MLRYSLVVFDMDGTLTEELLDFDAIRSEIGVPAGEGILEFIRHLEGEAKSRAKAILDRHEMAAARECRLHEGAKEILQMLKERGVQTALLTRNSRACAACVLERHGLSLDYVASREDEPHKPHPDSILNITRRFAADPRHTLMVGDYVYDLQAANAAGVDSALICIREGGKRPTFADQATYCISELMAVAGLVSGNESSSV